jgi:AbrB family looped-hinge helix DNA binding protein
MVEKLASRKPNRGRYPEAWEAWDVSFFWERFHTWYALCMAQAERQIVVGDRGRVVLPSEVRAALGLKAGSRMLLSTEKDGSLRLRPYRSVADQGRGMLAGLAPAGESMVDDLLAERRSEAAREARA